MRDEMSALDQNQTFAPQKVVSGLPLDSDRRRECQLRAEVASAVNKDTGGQRGKGKYDQQAAEYHSQPNAR